MRRRRKQIQKRLMRIRHACSRNKKRIGRGRKQRLLSIRNNKRQKIRRILKRILPNKKLILLRRQ